jgi:hypothetical protein
LTLTSILAHLQVYRIVRVRSDRYSDSDQPDSS